VLLCFAHYSQNYATNSDCCIRILTALLEYLDLFDRFVQSAAVKASSLPQNANIITHTYYARNNAGIIASSLYSTVLNFQTVEYTGMPKLKLAQLGLLNYIFTLD